MEKIEKRKESEMEVVYIYEPSEEAESRVSRAYNIFFEETLKRLEAKGIHLPF